MKQSVKYKPSIGSAFIANDAVEKPVVGIQMIQGKDILNVNYVVADNKETAAELISFINARRSASHDDLKEGQTWHLKLPRAAALTTGTIKSLTPNTVIIRNKWTPEGLRYCIHDVEFVERVL